MVALTDLTVRYTALVDAHVPRLAACLGDPHELVRRQALALLASLLSRVRTPETPLTLNPHHRRPVTESTATSLTPPAGPARRCSIPQIRPQCTAWGGEVQ